MLLIRLFLSFMKIGFSSFGGLSMIPVVNQEILSNGWMTPAEISDIVAIAEMTPGSLGINSATFVGLRTGGVLGSFAATLGVMIPSLTICMIAAKYLIKFKGNRYIDSALYAIKPVCIGMLIATVISLSGSNFLKAGDIYLQPIIIAIVAGIALIRYKASIPVVICISAVLGILIV